MIFRSIFLFFLISKPRFVRSEQNCLAVCVAFAEIPAELLKDIFTVPKNVPTICYYEILGIITSPSDEFFDKDTLFFVAWHPFLVENEYQRRISFFSYSRTKEEYTLEARYLMFGLETLPKDYDWKTCNVHRQAFYVIAIKNTTLYYMHCPLKTMIYFKALYCDPYTVDLTKNGLVPDSWNITQINRTDFNAYGQQDIQRFLPPRE
ncbi:unnamed protein product [Bursaphelenchus xylophilus]|uniref:(pine wood nematode) hypothetical protein n=1 Tax=Bursaphelenchus xylophilus TaxID=6326 RepID=A0A7I8XAF7_BURXY|nr:unnamed protein product [Bursaphelenchus xylophilus]CAG9131936.1 unnamed protein product [Bursaphelenchus xylophilus]